MTDLVTLAIIAAVAFAFATVVATMLLLHFTQTPSRPC